MAHLDHRETSDVLELAPSEPPRAAEAVRLVIWDLDETFWQGTLTEGGIEYVEATHQMVIELARRGIMSSICSKNDLAAVQDILTKKKLWDYFVFPSVDWSAKGPRLAALIEAVQLRPATVLFIDDNPMNRNEALYFVPDLQVADETVIPSLLADSRFKGKDDRKLSRLAQYKLLERRRQDQAVSTSNKDFLHASGITVQLEHDLTGQIDRVVELINRTNQLNYTKRRLPEDLMQARAALTPLLDDPSIESGLVKVRDRYGDYGWIGFYALDSRTRTLLHYCFSCRTLGMGVEQWLYQRLCYPSLVTVGEVLTNLHADLEPVTWITLADKPSGPRATAAPALASALLRGGCELQSLAPYLETFTGQVVGEFFRMRHGMAIRLDHPALLRYAMDGLSNPMLEAAGTIGYTAADFDTQLSGDTDHDYYVFSFWSNEYALYRHRILGLDLPISIPGMDNARNVLDAPVEPALADPVARSMIKTLRRDFTFIGAMPDGDFQAVLAKLLDAIPPGKPVFFLLHIDTWTNKEGRRFDMAWRAKTNHIVAEAAADRPNVHLVRMTDFMEADSDSTDGMHFERQVFHRIGDHIAKSVRLAEPQSAARVAR